MPTLKRIVYADSSADNNATTSQLSSSTEAAGGEKQALSSISCGGSTSSTTTSSSTAPRPAVLPEDCTSSGSTMPSAPVSSSEVQESLHSNHGATFKNNASEQEHHDQQHHKGPAPTTPTPDATTSMTMVQTTGDHAQQQRVSGNKDWGGEDSSSSNTTTSSAALHAGAGRSTANNTQTQQVMPPPSLHATSGGGDKYSNIQPAAIQNTPRRNAKCNQHPTATTSHTVSDPRSGAVDSALLGIMRRRMGGNTGTNILEVGNRTSMHSCPIHPPSRSTFRNNSDHYRADHVNAHQQITAAVDTHHHHQQMMMGRSIIPQHAFPHKFPHDGATTNHSATMKNGRPPFPHPHPHPHYLPGQNAHVQGSFPSRHHHPTSSHPHPHPHALSSSSQLLYQQLLHNNAGQRQLPTWYGLQSMHRPTGYFNPLYQNIMPNVGLLQPHMTLFPQNHSRTRIGKRKKKEKPKLVHMYPTTVPVEEITVRGLPQFVKNFIHTERKIRPKNVARIAYTVIVRDWFPMSAERGNLRQELVRHGYNLDLKEMKTKLRRQIKIYLHSLQVKEKKFKMDKVLYRNLRKGLPEFVKHFIIEEREKMGDDVKKLSSITRLVLKRVSDGWSRNDKMNTERRNFLKVHGYDLSKVEEKSKLRQQINSFAGNMKRREKNSLHRLLLTTNTAQTAHTAQDDSGKSLSIRSPQLPSENENKEEQMTNVIVHNDKSVGGDSAGLHAQRHDVYTRNNEHPPHEGFEGANLPLEIVSSTSAMVSNIEYESDYPSSDEESYLDGFYNEEEGEDLPNDFGEILPTQSSVSGISATEYEKLHPSSDEESDN